MSQRQYLLERVSDAAVVQLYADGFDGLPLREKVLAWHLYQAALAGRDIYYDQRYRHGLAMRGVLEAVIRCPDGIDQESLDEITRYTKLFWLNSGPYSQLTSRKVVLALAPERFEAAVRQAVANGALVPLADGDSMDALLERLRPAFFDAAWEPFVTNKTPDPGGDVLAASANNLYCGVSSQDLEGFQERYSLNSRLVKTPAGLVEEVYRAGGRYGSDIARVVSHLEDAVPFATPAMQEALRALIRFYRTGEDEDRRAYDIAWVADKDSPVDTINGFIEVYLDARGAKGAWEGIVFHVNAAKTDACARIAAHAQWFEDHMPYAPEYRRAQVQGVTARAIDVIVEVGDAGPMTPIGINLPNDDGIREVHGSKSVSLANVVEAYEKSQPPEFRREFSWSAEEAARAEKWGGLAGELTTNLHEIVGHGSGQVSERLTGSPQALLRECYSTLEETRADLVALYFVADPVIVELGLVGADDHAELVRAEYEGYARNALVQLRRIREGATIEEDHMRNRQAIVHWLMTNTRAIERRRRDGKTYYVTVDTSAFREGCGRLLAEVQRIKSEGDYPAAKAVFDAYGTRFEPDVRDEIVQRVDALHLPSYTGFVMPELSPVHDEAGRVVDVRVTYPCSLTAQMLSYSAQREAAS
jgi:dipeptidyl-peptidase-3